ncbi:uncharacterized protein LOC116164742 [Photinus pyralis]|uniref:uncharacterized protein LOC116160370 n=1 Tax=Photinus pyralis TaxID=7054 RepID=UPI001267528E|nr:uncharacterized protein LOC116160370 [Photinus pyralis]XP_031334819.1 uncharacterized protein LOC116164742 [Photinus pyralis]
MASEVFYDSLEGEHSTPSDSPSDKAVSSITGNDNLIVIENEVVNLSSSSCVLVIKYPPNHSSQCSRKSSNSSLKSEFERKCSLNSARLDHPRDISTLVPLYSGDIDKFGIKCRKCCSTPSQKPQGTDCFVHDEKVRTGSSKKCETSRKKLIKCRNTKMSSKGSEIFIPEVRSRSYLTMFHRRIGYPEQTPNIDIKDTQRSVFGDTKRSLISLTSNENEQFRDAEDCQSDTTSFYMKAITESNQNKIGSGDANQSPAIVAPPPSSTSEIFSCTTPTRCANKSKRRVNKLYPIPDMGGLGADTVRFKDKMELRKRQLQYGQRASNRNRIKLKELDILKNLKNEIAESNAINNKNVH